MKSVVGLYENRQAVGGATDPQLHSNRTVIHFKREYLVQLYYTRGETPTFVNYVIAHNKARPPAGCPATPSYKVAKKTGDNFKKIYRFRAKIAKNIYCFRAIIA